MSGGASTRRRRSFWTSLAPPFPAPPQPPWRRRCHHAGSSPAGLLRYCCCFVHCAPPPLPPLSPLKVRSKVYMAAVYGGGQNRTTTGPAPGEHRRAPAPVRSSDHDLINGRASKEGFQITAEQGARMRLGIAVSVTKKPFSSSSVIFNSSLHFLSGITFGWSSGGSPTRWPWRPPPPPRSALRPCPCTCGCQRLCRPSPCSPCIRSPC